MVICKHTKFQHYSTIHYQMRTKSVNYALMVNKRATFNAIIELGGT